MRTSPAAVEPSAKVAATYSGLLPYRDQPLAEINRHACVARRLAKSLLQCAALDDNPRRAEVALLVAIVDRADVAPALVMEDYAAEGESMRSDGVVDADRLQCVHAVGNDIEEDTGLVVRLGSCFVDRGVPARLAEGEPRDRAGDAAADDDCGPRHGQRPRPASAPRRRMTKRIAFSPTPVGSATTSAASEAEVRPARLSAPALDRGLKSVIIACNVICSSLHLLSY